MNKKSFRSLSYAVLSAFLLIFSSAFAVPVVFTTDTLIGSSELAYDGADIVAQSCVVTIQGDHAFGAFTVESNAVVDAASTNLWLRDLALNEGQLYLGGGAVLTVSNALTLVTNSLVVCRGTNTTEQVDGGWAGRGVVISAKHVVVDAGSRISADGQGYASQAADVNNGYGPGYGQGGGTHAAAGGSYGGRGGKGDYDIWDSSATYGLCLGPMDLGSSGGTHWGGPSGAGGGAIRLIVSGTMALDGWITANGMQASGHAGGGAGGSVWLTTLALAGSGGFTANGGACQPGYAGGGGGGGRIAVQSAEWAGFTGFSASTASGGAGGWYGGAAGSAVFIDTSSVTNDLDVYQNGELQGASAVFGTVTLHEGAALSIATNFALHAEALNVATGATLTVGGGSTVTVAGELSVASTATVLCGGVDTAAPVDGRWSGRGVTICADSLTVEAEACISADGQGYASQREVISNGIGPGFGEGGNIHAGAGGSYGGRGGTGDYNTYVSSAAYGACLYPLDLGSSGGTHWDSSSGAGGGAIRLIVGGTTVLNGWVTANGSSAYHHAGGGAGGSVWLTTHALSGSGGFTAQGGAYQPGYSGGGGGGGRIAVHSAERGGYTGYGVTRANGGAGAWYNGAVGTVVFVDTSSATNDLDVYQTADLLGTTATFGTVTLHEGAALSLSTNFLLQANVLNVGTGATMTVGGGATVSVAGTLSVASGATLLCQSTDNAAQVGDQWVGRGVTLHAGDVVVEAGGRISADGQGYVSMHDQGHAAGVGPGGSGTMSAGSHGGQGSSGSWNQSVGTTYGDALEPVSLGSSGGSWESRWSGAGGGAIRLTVDGTLTLDGTVSANGGTPVEHSGAGAGGALWITAAVLTGSGDFQAAGGSYSPGYAGGGGGGGRVAVYYGNGAGFAGFALSSVAGGSGWNGYVGSVGTICFIDTSVAGGGLHVYGNMAPQGLTNTFGAVTVHEGGVLTLAGGSALQAGSLLRVLSNGLVRCQSIDKDAQVSGQWVGRGVTVSASNVCVDAGGLISADSQGYASRHDQGSIIGFGPGGGGALNGASHGGQGSYGSWYGTLGPVYGSVLEPLDLGSSGGSYESTWSGAGGGAIRLIASGTLTLDGIISANGGTPSSHSGAGAGGSLWITTAVLSGSGVFQAVGGTYIPGYAGGAGGGGRIAVYGSDDSGFTGFSTSCVAGGAGWNGYEGGRGSLFYIDTSVPGNHLHVYGSALLPGVASVFNAVTVHGGGVLSIPGGTLLTADTVQVLSNATVRCLSVDTAAQVGGTWAGRGAGIDAGALVVDAGGEITADGEGYAAVSGGVVGKGPGAGQNYAAGGGGGYGGHGGQGYQGTPGGLVYGSSETPDNLGSSGGSGNWWNSWSGAGGGSVWLQVGRTLTVDGVISANGNDAEGGSGGGSGGSLWVTAPSVQGGGILRVNGGEVGYVGGGGGGGRLYCLVGSLAGELGLQSLGGGGANGAWGGGGGSVVIVYTNAVAPATNNISVAPGAGGSSTAGLVVLRHDTDLDGLSDEEESGFFGTDPNKADSDGDGQSDGDEVTNGMNPADAALFQTSISGEVLYSGTQTGKVCVVAQEAGRTNLVLSLTGSGYVDVGSTPSLDITNAITMEAWVCPSSVDGDRPVIAKEGSSARQAYWFGIYNGQFGLLLGNGSEWGLWARASGTVVAGQWCHLAVTWDGSAWRCYQNGNLVGWGDYVGTLPVSPAPFQIGQNSEWASTHFVGQMDRVQVWSRALTELEVRGSMSRALTGSEPDLAGYWNFDDGTVNDLSASANHGTLQGDATIAAAVINELDLYRVEIPTPGPYTITGIPSLTNYTVSCFRDFNENGAWDFWESRAFYPANPVRVTNAVAGVDLTLPVVAPPTADAGGPYSVDEFTGNALAGGWTITLDGGASTDTVSYATLLAYRWDLGADTFEGEAPNVNKWYVAPNGVVQSNGVAVTGNGSWEQRYLVSRDTYARAEGLSFEFTAKFTAGDIVVGWKNDGGYFHYNQFVHSLDFYNGGIYLGEYTRGWSLNTGYSYTYDTWYDVRIDLKAGLGARYYYRLSGTSSWTFLGETSSAGETSLRRGLSIGSGTCTLAAVREIAVGKTPAYRLYGAGTRTATLRVTDPTGLMDSNATTVTTLVNDPPVAAITPASQTQLESGASEKVWTFPFAVTGSSDDHGIYTYEWDWSYDGTFTPSGNTDATTTHAWTNAGVYTVALRVTDQVLQTCVTSATVTVVNGTPPVAVPGGPYTFDEFSGNVSTGAWNIVVSGTNSYDNESSLSHYLWTFGSDAFEGTNVNAHKWMFAPAGVSQSNAMTLVSATYAWGQCYLFSRDFSVRGYGVAFESLFTPGPEVYAMIGFMNTGTRCHYDQMPYALYFCNGALKIYEDAADRGQVGVYTPGSSYQVRIELKPEQGARYYIKVSGEALWTLLYDSSYGSASAFRRGLDVHYGTVVMDDLSEMTSGATPLYRLYEAGTHPVTLTVWDQALNTGSATTTVTLVKNAPPVANMGGNKYGSETNCASGLWTFLFSGAQSTDDHEIYTYEWDWNYAEPLGFRPSGDTGSSIRHTFSSAQIGSNPVALRVTDHALQTSVHTASVILSPGQPPEADAGGPYTVEVGAWARLDGTGSSDDYEVARYAWSFGDGGSGTGTRPQHQYASVGDYTVTLTVYDNLEQASTAVTSTVHVVEASAPTADAGGPYSGAAGGPPVYFDASLSHDASGNADGIAKYLWDVNVDSDSDGNGTADDDMDRVGLRPFYTYAAEGVYTARLTVVSGASLSNSATAVVTIVPNLSPNVICVPYHGNTNEYHPTYAGLAVTLKGVVRDTGTLVYSWDFGDGATTDVQIVGNTYAIEAKHAYAGGDGKGFVARLTVWDASGLAGSDDYRVMLFGSNTETRAQIAVDEGLWWLHKNQNKAYGMWNGSTAASTASALQAFEINGHRVDGFGDEDPYVETVDTGFRYLFSTLRANVVGASYAPPVSSGYQASAVTMPTSYSLGQESVRTGVWPSPPALPTRGLLALSDGAPSAPSLMEVAASNGIAVDVNSSYPPYELGMVMDAVAASQARTFTVATGGENIKGRSFYDLLQDMVDMYAWGQNQPWQGGRGGWRYSWRSGSADNSVSQWGAIGMLAAEDNFGIACPDYVKQENLLWLSASWNGNDFGYDGAGGHPWGTYINTTPSAMVQMAMDDVATTNYLWEHTEDVIAAGWAGTYGNQSSVNYYGRYALTKALRLARPSKVENFNNGFKWYEDETNGIRRIITDQQHADGSWIGTYYGNTGGELGYELSTAWAIVMLTPSLFTQPPEAVITAPSVWGYGLPLTLTAERSFSVDPKKSISKYLWDFDNDGNFDLITTDPADPASVWTWPDPHPAVTGDVPVTVTVRLKVIDSDDPPQSDETFKTIIVAEPPHAPYARATVPKSTSTGVQIRLSGSGSFDIDPTDLITEYQWDFNNDDIPDLVTNAATFHMRFDVAGLQTIALRVVDNGVMNGDVKLMSEWDYTTCSVGDNQAPVADAGGPYTVYEGLAVTLFATNSIDPNGDDLLYAWDFDGDGSADATNAVTEHTWTLPGSNTVWLTVTDTALSNTASVSFMVLAVNHAPSFAKGADQTVDEDAGTRTVAGWAGGLSAGPAHEAWQTFAFACTNTAPALFSAAPSVSTNGTLTFTPAPNANGTATVSLWLRDNGGTAYGGQDTSTTQTFQIVVNAVNDAPVLTPTNAVLASITEDAVSNPGTTVAALVGTSISDVDAGAVQGIAVYTNANGNGAWQYSTNAGVSWSAMGSVSTNAALLLRSADRMRFLPNMLNGTMASFGYFAWDQTSGGAALKTSVASRGGTAAFSLLSDTASITVTAVNDAPTLTVPTNRVMNELTLLAVTNTATDVDLPADTLKYELLAWPAGMTIGTNTGAITWTPSEAQGPSTNTVTVRVYDSGTPSLAATNSFTVWVSEVNSAPALTVPTNRVMNELTLLSVTNTATDADSPANTLRYELLAGPSGLTLGTNTGAIAWTPTEAQGPSTNTVTVRVYDNGTPSLAATNSFTVWVSEVNSAPALTVPTNRVVSELTLLSVTNTATDADIPANTLRFELLSGPSGLTLGTNTGAIAWTPTEAQGPSTNIVTVRVYDNGTPSLAATNSFTVWVSEVNSAPALTVPTNRVMSELTLLAVTNTATDADLPANTLRYELLAGPSGLTLGTNTGAIAWTPSEAQGPSTNTVTVRVYDNGTPSLAATNSFTVWVSEVNSAPALTVPTNRVMNELTLLAVTNTATDADIPANTLRYELLAGPAGLTLGTNTGAIAWTPTEAQGPSTNTVTVRVVDSGTPSLAATNSFTLWVSEVNSAPALTVPTNRVVNELTLLSVTNTAADADLPANTLRYELLAGPSGLTLGTNTGAVAWTPTEAQGPSTNTVTVRVVDSGVPVKAATNSFTVWVSEVNSAPALPVQTNRTIKVLTLLSVTNAAMDADLPVNALTYQLLAAPAGAAISNGVITWTPTALQGATTNTFTTRVADNGAPSLAATNSFQVIVLAANTRPVIAAIPNIIVVAGETLAFRIPATDSDRPSNTLTYAMSAYSMFDPPVNEAHLDPQSGQFSWASTAWDEGNVLWFVVTVTDNGVPPLAASRMFQVSVSSLAPAQDFFLSAGKPSMHWSVMPARFYQIQYKNSLLDGTWQNLGGEIEAVGGVLLFEDNTDPAPPSRFYRALLVPEP